MATQSNQPLPDGYQLQNYKIEKLLSSGGFSIVYLARDEFGTPVAVKEYLPSALVLRSANNGAEVQVNSDENLAVFRHGLKCFFEEGRALATISHPNIVRVENFFRANETVYMVMQYVRGRTLQFHISRHRHEFTESFIRRMFTHLLNGLREVHSKKLLHLDIKPANVYITMEGKPVLLDFGADEPGGVIDKPLTHQTIANMIGASRETVSRTMREFQDLGWVKVDRRRIAVTDADALRKRAQVRV